MRRQKSTPEDVMAVRQAWKQRILDCRNSGLSVAQWCFENNININMFYRWQSYVDYDMNLRLRDVEKSVGSQFVEVVADNDFLNADTKVACIHLNNAVITIYPQATPEMVVAICKGVASC